MFDQVQQAGVAVLTIILQDQEVQIIKVLGLHQEVHIQDQAVPVQPGVVPIQDQDLAPAAVPPIAVRVVRAVVVTQDPVAADQLILLLVVPAVAVRHHSAHPVGPVPALLADQAQAVAAHLLPGQVPP